MQAKGYCTPVLDLRNVFRSYQFNILYRVNKEIDAWRTSVNEDVYKRQSLECCYESPLNYHLRHHPETKTLYLGQDNDLGGAQSRAACRVLLQQQNWPGRVVDKIPCTPSGDWNDDLRAFCSSAHPSKTTSPVIPSKGGEKR